MQEETIPKALLIGTYHTGADLKAGQEHLNELARLSTTLGVEVEHMELCPLRKIDRSTFLGSGKIEELVALAEAKGIDQVIFDDELSPSQQRNLEKLFKKSVFERTEVILHVFAKHARTREARLQVEIAQVRYQLPRLKRLWTHLSRQRGGGLAVKGEGEKQIELDRRLVQGRLEKLQEELEIVRRQRTEQRKERARSGIPIFAIVGYTNAGKSSLMNALTDAGVLVEDKLFATLDTTTRKFILPNRQEVLLIDTVGFIRKIPHQLVAAFKSTLEEAVFADVLLHVVDTSNPLAPEQAEATLQVLKELGAHNRPMITVLNKIDAAIGEMRGRLSALLPKTVEVSAIERIGLEALAERMMEELQALRTLVKLKIPQERYDLVSEVLRTCEVLDQEYEENDVLLRVRAPHVLMHKLEPFVQK
ncbi:MAG: GTPase HflX [Verrucomicrobia bacterium]|nr:GTPase HflX [Verrucomicrobiota bacterium]